MSYAPTPIELAERLESGNPMSTEEMLSWALALRQHQDSAIKDLNEAKGELRKLDIRSKLGDHAAIVYMDLQDFGPRDAPFTGTAVSWVEKLDCDPRAGLAALDCAVRRINDQRPYLVLSRDLAEFTLRFYSKRNEAFHTWVRELRTAAKWDKLAQHFGAELEQLPRTLEGLPTDDKKKFREMLEYSRDSMIKSENGKWVGKQAPKLVPLPVAKPRFDSLDGTSKGHILRAAFEASKAHSLRLRNVRSKFRQGVFATRRGGSDPDEGAYTNILENMESIFSDNNHGSTANDPPTTPEDPAYLQYCKTLQKAMSMLEEVRILDSAVAQRALEVLIIRLRQKINEKK